DHPVVQSFPTRRSSDLFDLQLGVFQFGFFYILVGERIVQYLLIGLRVDLEKFLPLCYEGTFIYIYFFQNSLNLWTYFHIYLALRSEEHTSELQSRENLV